MSSPILTLFKRWQVDDAQGQHILGLSQDRYLKWKDGSLEEGDDELTFRLALLFSIHTSLCTIFMEPARGYRWIRRQNEIFGQSPLDLIASGDFNALTRVQTYLAAEAQGW